MSHSTRIRSKFKNATVIACLRSLGWLSQDNFQKLPGSRVPLSIPQARYGVWAFADGTTVCFQYDSDDRAVRDALVSLNAECARHEVKAWTEEIGFYLTEAQENGELVFICEEA